MGSKAKWGRDQVPRRSEQDSVRQIMQELARDEVPASPAISAEARARLEDLGRASCALAHELRQPLFTIAMANENLRLMLENSDVKSARMLQSIARVTEQVERAQAIIAQTLEYAKGAEAQQESCDLGEAAVNAVRFLEMMIERAGIGIELRGLQGLSRVGLSRIEMEQVFVNLLRNAVESIVDRDRAGWNGTGRITIVAQQFGSQIRCLVSDNGAGLKQDMTEAVFQPFFTTKSREGTGLGLHICRQILAKAEGAIRLLPGREGGAQVEIRLPWIAHAPAIKGPSKGSSSGIVAA